MSRAQTQAIPHCSSTIFIAVLPPSSRLPEGIAKERTQLSRIREKATYIIDTSELKKTVLKSKIIRLFGATEGEKLNINVLSFGFKFGLPMDADLVFDVRFLPNPFYEEKLKHKSGMVPEVGAYIEKSRVTKSFEKKLDDMLTFLIPEYIKEGKNR